METFVICQSGHFSSQCTLCLADGDVLVDPVDVAHLFDVLPNGIFNRVVPYQGFNHMDFLTAIDAPTLIYNDIFEVLNNY